MVRLCGQFIIFAALVASIPASPLRFLGGFGQEEDLMYEDYDLYYDQKQNGTENIRVNLDGVAFIVPISQTMSTHAMSLLSGIAMDFLSGGPLTDSSDDGDYSYDQEISQSPYIETIVKPGGSQESSESTQAASMEITPPAPPTPPTIAPPKDSAENEISDAATTPDQEGSTRRSEKRRYKEAHRRNRHPFFRPMFNRFLSRLMPA